MNRRERRKRAREQEPDIRNTADFDMSWEYLYMEHKITLRDVMFLKQLAGVRLAMKDLIDELRGRIHHHGCRCHNCY